MALPPWTIELLRRGLSDAANHAREPERLRKLRDQASELLHELPETAARSIDRVIQSAEAGKQSVQRWSRKHTALAVPMLNASGILYHEQGTGVALPHRVVEVGQEMLRGDVAIGTAGSDRIGRRLRRAISSNDDLDVLVANNFSAALSALSLIAVERTLVVHRHHAIRLLGGVPLPEAFGTILPVVEEVGASDAADAADFEGLERACVIQADSGQQPVELLDLQDPEAIQAVVLPVATVRHGANDFVPSAENTLEKGADIVIMPGDGLADGPACGLLIGRRKELATIAVSAAWPALQANDAVRAMMCVAIESASSSQESTPLETRLAAGEDNLRDRAERMAARVGAAEHVATARVTADEAAVTRDGRWSIPSRQLKLTHRSLNPDDWALNLAADIPLIAAGTTAGALKIDFRWLDPADDGTVADALCGTKTA